MTKQFIQNLVASAWLLYIIFDITYAEPIISGVIVSLGWVLTVWASVRWGSGLTSSLYLKLATLTISAFGAFLCYSLLIEVTGRFLPDADSLNQVAVYTTTQSILMSCLAAAILAIPLVVVFRKINLLLAISVALPVVFFQLPGIFDTRHAITQLLLIADVIFLGFSIWAACKVATNQMTSNYSVSRNPCTESSCLLTPEPA